MKKGILLFVLGVSIVFAATEQGRKILRPTKEYYEQKWAQVETLIEEDRPISAIQKLKLLEDEANKFGQAKYSIASSMEEARLMMLVDQSKRDSLVQELKRKVKESESGYVKAWLSWVLVDSFNENISLMAVVDQYKSDLQQHSLIDQSPILTVEPDEACKFPSVWHYLTDRQIQYYQSSYSQRNFGDRQLFSDRSDFLKYRYDQKTVPSSYKKIIALYQSLLQEEDSGLVLRDIERLKWVYYVSNNITDGKALFEQALQRLQATCRNSNYEPQVAYELIQSYLSDYTGSPSEAKKDSEIERLCKSLVVDILERFPKRSYCARFNQIIKQFSAPRATVEFRKSLYPGDQDPLIVSSKNVDAIFLSIIPVKADTIEASDLYQSISIGNNKPIYEQKSIVRRKGKTSDWSQTSLKLPSLAYGIYQIEMQLKGDTTLTFVDRFLVTRFGRVSRSIAGENDILIFDWKSGHPISDATVELWSRPWRDTLYTRKSTWKTDQSGRVLLPDDLSYDSYYKVAYEQDKYSPLEQLYVGSRYKNKISSSAITLYMDRPIYRSTDTITFGGVVYESIKRTLHANKTITCSLYDTERKQVSSQTVNTSDLGLFRASFVLPKGMKNGTCYVEASIDEPKPLVAVREYFDVEEIKVPTIEVFTELPEILNDGLIDDSLRFKVRGHVMTTNGLSTKAEVRYSIGYNRMFVRAHESQELGDLRSIDSDEEGNFTIQVAVERMPFSTFRNFLLPYLHIEVTDQKGESQETMVALTNRLSLRVTAKIPAQRLIQDRSPLTIEVDRGRFISSNMVFGRYVVERKVRGSIKQISKGEWKENDSLKIDELPFDRPGSYQIRFFTGPQLKEQEVGLSAFDIVDLRERKMVYDAPLWIYSPQDTIQLGGEVQLMLGSSSPNRFVRIDLYGQSKRVTSYNVTLGNKVETYSFPYLSEWGDEVVLSLISYKEGEESVFSKRIIYAANPAKLDIEIHTLRSPMIPGSKEQWTLLLRDSEGKPHSGTGFITLYDASLDRLARSEWKEQPFLLSPSTEQPICYFQQSLFLKNRVDISSVLYSKMTRDQILFSSQEISGQPNFKSGQVYSLGVRSELVPSAPPVEPLGMLSPDVPRINFSTSAIALQPLCFNTQGEAEVSFRLPDAFTSWRLKLMAYTSDFRSVTKEDTIVARKELMIQGQAPRFVYENDKVLFSAIVTNLSEDEICVNPKMFIGNSSNLTPNDSLSTGIYNAQEGAKLLLKSGERKSVNFEVNVPSGKDSLKVCFSASADKQTDSEEYLIERKKRTQLLEEGRIAYLSEVSGRKVQKDFPSINAGTVRLEYVASPLALLYEMDRQWSKESLSSLTDYVSQLVLWSRGAKLSKEYNLPLFLSEQERKEKIKQMIGQMQQLQMQNGGFAWFEGMQASYSLTSWVLQSTYMLREEYPLLSEMQERALKYCDQIFMSRYKNDSISGKSAEVISEDDLLYLSVRTKYERIIPFDVLLLERMKRCVDRLEHEWISYSLPNRVNVGLLLHSWKRERSSRKIVESMKEYTVYAKTSGRYFPNNIGETGDLWNVAVHAKTMELFSKVGIDQKWLEQMAKWLILQRQGVDWGTRPSSIEAIESLLKWGVKGVSPIIQENANPFAHYGVKQAQESNPYKAVYYFTAEEWNRLPETISIPKGKGEFGWIATNWNRQAQLSSIKPTSNVLMVENHTALDDSIGRSQLIMKVVSERDLSYVKVVVPKAACQEIVTKHSGYQFIGGLWMYMNLCNDRVEFYIEYLPKGSYKINLPLWIERRGIYQLPVPTIESTFAPQFRGNGEAALIHVN